MSALSPSGGKLPGGQQERDPSFVRKSDIALAPFADGTKDVLHLPFMLSHTQSLHRSVDVIVLRRCVVSNRPYLGRNVRRLLLRLVTQLTRLASAPASPLALRRQDQLRSTDELSEVKPNS